MMPSHIEIVDTGDAVAKHLKYVLEEKKLLNPSHASGKLDFWSNSLDPNAASVIEKLWGKDSNTFSYKGLWS
jgi:glutamate racemase